MRTVTLALATATVITAACSDLPTPSEPRGAPSGPHRTTMSSSASGLEPGADDRILFDTRTSLQQAQTLREALALWGISSDTRPNWGFTTNLDGAGKHALRVDWTQNSLCSPVSPVLTKTLPTPAPKKLFVAWRQLLGRTATGGGLGNVGQFTVFRSTCDITLRHVTIMDRSGSTRRFEYKWPGPAPSRPTVHLKTPELSIVPNQGWEFFPQDHVGEANLYRVYIQAESATGAADGIVRVWVDDRLLTDRSGLAIGAEAITNHKFPWTSFAPVQSQSEYFWDLVIWEPSDVPPPPPPPPSAPVATVTVTPPEATVEVGKTVQLNAELKDADGNVLTGRVVTWTSSDEAVASVSNTGLVTGKAEGAATITATSEGKLDTSDITVLPAPPPPPPPPPGSPVTFVGAGDIADCGSALDEPTAKLLDGISGTVFTAGDNAYPDGTDANFANCYNPTWGRHKARTRPSPGNHDYHTSGAAGYFKYFGENAGPSGRGYFSYDLGEWHMISLNSNISMSAGSAQEKWLREDLAANPKKCTLAYWHHPRFSTGQHGNATSTQPLWQALYDADADVVISGHDHTYERFAPQTPTGTADPVRGIREFIVGTGGRSLYSFGTPKPNSEVRNNTTHGVIKLTLHAASYDWEFVPIAGKTFTDAGTGSCHGLPEGPPPPPAPVATVTVTPPSATVEAGKTVQLTAELRDADGNVLTGRPITWTSSNEAAAKVSPTGLVTGIAEGSATITATSEGKFDTSDITVTPAPPPPPPPPPGASCLSQEGPTITLSGVKSSPYSNTSLAANTKIDATTAQFLTTAKIPVTVGGGPGVCFRGGETIGQLAPSTSWSTMHDTYAFKLVGISNFKLENLREFDYGDGITIHENSASSWSIRGAYFKYMRDDCIQNDWLNAGAIEDSFFDGCYVGLSADAFSSTQDGSNNTITVKNSLWRLQDMDRGYSKPGHGGFFKWDANAPQLSLHGNVYRVDSKSIHSGHTLSPPAGKLKDCSNNVMIWLGSGPFPEQLPGCFTLLTGAEGLQYWTDAAARWNANHPTTLMDVGPPIVSMYSPAGSATLTGVVGLTATAVDDRDVAGVQFKLDGQNIGSEVTTESPLTKFTLSWDSRDKSNGTYTLTATARDASGNTKSSVGISVTISN